MFQKMTRIRLAFIQCYIFALSIYINWNFLDLLTINKWNMTYIVYIK